MGALLDSLHDKDEGAFHRWTKSEAWATVEQLLDANGTISQSLAVRGCIFIQLAVILVAVFRFLIGNMSLCCRRDDSRERDDN